MHIKNSLSMVAGALALLACAAGCGRHTGADNTFSVMTYNLGRYTLEDRDGDGQANDPKPAEARAAIVRLIARDRPDVLAIQEIGNPAIFEEFCGALRDAGVDYPNKEYLQRGNSDINMAVLSRFPMAARLPHLDDTYSIGSTNIPVAPGFLDVVIQARPDYAFRLFSAMLKDKTFHALGQTEMRRNEARLLNNYVRKALKEDPEANLLVVGTMNDTPNSAPLRELMGEKEKYLIDLRPADDAADVWTYFNATDDQYHRLDYMLASRGMIAELLPDRTFAVSHPDTFKASEHRPVIAMFRTPDIQSNASP